MASTTGQFAVTRWTLVLRAKAGDDSGQKALSELCETYYAPVVAFLRYRAPGEDAAREQAHAFFARVLEGQALVGANPDRGRFRSYLLGALRHFLADASDRARAEKRGGGVEPIELDESMHGEATLPGNDEAAFDREWALTVINRALTSIADEWAAAGKAAQFEALKPALVASGEAFDLAASASQQGMSEGAVKVAVHRLRARFRDVVKQEIAQTVPAESDVDEELRYLVAVLMGRSP
jgi:RNA polymerase sigma-70 factor (ECF subfamily)